MQLVRCSVHDLEFRLPTMEEEFITGKLHDEVERCQCHVEENKECKLVSL